MKDKKIVNTDTTDVEKILKSKMNELSDSVDCFDRISARLFAEEHFGISDDEFTVSGLENITGRSNVPKILKWTATAVAAAICIAVIPHNNFVRRMFSRVTDGENNFPAIMEELETELESGTYIYIDVPLKYYIENDVLVTPLFCCPFEDCNKEDANVRLFTKQIDGIETTQMYAVLYDGIYTEKNIIAAAESKYKFTAKDMTYTFNDDIKFDNFAETAAEIYFTGGQNGEILDSEGNQVFVASFTNNVLTKDEQNRITNQSSEIIFGHKNDSEYFYDILINESSNENFSRDNVWKNSVYFNGNSSYPKTSESKFTRTNIFSSLDNTAETQDDFLFVYPMTSDNKNQIISTTSDYNDFAPNEKYLSISDNHRHNILGIVPFPENIQALLSLKMYFAQPEDNDMEINIFCSQSYINTIYSLQELFENLEQEKDRQEKIKEDFEALLNAEYERIRIREEKLIKEIEENIKEIEEAQIKREIEEAQKRQELEKIQN